MVLMDGFQFVAKQLKKKQIILKCTLLKNKMPKYSIRQIYLIPVSFVDDQIIDQDS